MARSLPPTLGRLLAANDPAAFEAAWALFSQRTPLSCSTYDRVWIFLVTRNHVHGIESALQARELETRSNGNALANRRRGRRGLRRTVQWLAASRGPDRGAGSSQRDMLRTTDRRDPYYWAAYQLSGGETQAVDQQSVTGERRPAGHAKHAVRLQ